MPTDWIRNSMDGVNTKLDKAEERFGVLDWRKNQNKADVRKEKETKILVTLMIEKYDQMYVLLKIWKEKYRETTWEKLSKKNEKPADYFLTW